MQEHYTRTKICCISSIEEAELALRYGADNVGLVSTMPSGPGVISDDLIAKISGRVPPGIGTFLLTSSRDPAEVVRQVRAARVNTVQLVDSVESEMYSLLRSELPNVRIVQVIHVVGSHSIREAASAARVVDALLLDSGNPNLPTKELGGTGRVHDWSISKTIVAESRVPVFLAGGINAMNVADAIRTVRPFGVDLCSSVRSAGRLDEEKLAELFRSVRAA